MTLSTLLVAAWMALPAGGSAALDPAILPALSVPVSLSKTLADAAIDDGSLDGSSAKRPWSAGRRPLPLASRWCQVSMRAGFGEAAADKDSPISTADIERFALAHELGRCLDQRPFPDTAEELIRHEAFADAFASCLMASEGRSDISRAMSAKRLAVGHRRGRMQSRSILAAIDFAQCQPAGPALLAALDAGPASNAAPGVAAQAEAARAGAVDADLYLFAGP